MTTKPDYIKWIPDNDPSKIDDPGPTKSGNGFNYREKVPFDFLNWLFNKVGKWFLGLQGGYYDIVIGSSTQVTNNEATHVVGDLNDTLVVSGSRVLLLDGTHTLTGSLSLSNTHLKVVSESPLAILNSNAHQVTFSGLRSWLRLRINNSTPGDIIISGAGSIFEGIDVPIVNITTSNGAVARTSGTSSGLKYPKLIGDVTGNLTGNADTATDSDTLDNFHFTSLASGTEVTILTGTERRVNLGVLDPFDFLQLAGATNVLSEPLAIGGKTANEAYMYVESYSSAGATDSFLVIGNDAAGTLNVTYKVYKLNSN
jgi:hypothetical protein